MACRVRKILILRINMNWSLKNTFYDELPPVFFDENSPSKIKNPKLELFNKKLALDLSLGEFNSPYDLEILSGNTLAPNSKTLSMAYNGHQFGHFVKLGDGRAHLLGEQITDESKVYDIQLKGSGQTSFSRSGDGRASLGPMLREYIISEAMHHLGVPTTRSLALVSTNEPVYREKILSGAILTRISESYIRVGTFEHAATLNDKESLKSLADYTIKRLYPESKNYLDFFKKVSIKQAKLIAQWMSFGFIHGVMNTDNMSICGETIDYGPCAFLDEYNSSKVFSSIDHMKRYAFNKQASMAQWNLARFAETLIPLFHDNLKNAIQIAEQAIEEFPNHFKKEWINLYSKKLGLSHRSGESNLSLIQSLLKLMEEYKADFTLTFRALADDITLETELFKSLKFLDWKKNWKTSLKQESYTIMKSNNPIFIARNHLVEACIQEAITTNTFVKTNNLLEVLQNPFEKNINLNHLSSTPDEAQKITQTFCGT